MVVEFDSNCKKWFIQKDVPVEAPALANVGTARKKEKNTFGWKECHYIFSLYQLLNCFSNWWYGRNYSYTNCKR